MGVVPHFYYDCTTSKYHIMPRTVACSGTSPQLNLCRISYAHLEGSVVIELTSPVIANHAINAVAIWDNESIRPSTSAVVVDRSCERSVRDWDRYTLPERPQSGHRAEGHPTLTRPHVQKGSPLQREDDRYE